MVIPAILKILIVFFSMLAFTRLKVPLGVAIAFGGIILNLWAGAGIDNTLSTVFKTVTSLPFWLMLFVTSLIFEFGRYLSKPKNSQGIISIAYRLGGRHGKTWGLISIPAIIGLVPMPAGALFSAPIVDKTAGDGPWTPTWKAAVNYWFRHTWEYWWPLYPGIILSLAIFDVRVNQFIKGQIPFTIASVLVGYLFLIRPYSRYLTVKDPLKSTTGVSEGLKATIPLLVLTPCIFIFPGIFERLMPNTDPQAVRLIAMLAGIALALVPVWLDERKQDKNEFLEGILSTKSLNISVTVAGILLFQALLKSSDLLPIAREDLHASGVPIVVIIAVLPLLSGFVTGLALGFAGTAFPLVAMLYETGSVNLPLSAVIALAYGFGYMGMMLSPVHLCLLVTSDYFNVRIFRIYRAIGLCIIVMTLFTILASWLYGLM